MSSVHYFEAPQAGKLRRGLLDRLRTMLRCQAGEGRKRIDPEQPWGTWATGWTGPVVPGKRG